MKDTLSAEEYAVYVCPACKGSLEFQPPGLCCPACSRLYPLEGSIPDFLAPGIEQVADPLIQRMNHVDRGSLKWMAGLYEGRLWYPLVIRMFLGANTTSLADLAGRIGSALDAARGPVLDAACGTATFSRRVASSTRKVFGIDISMAMLQTGAGYVRHEGQPNIHLARARVENLPFPAEFFDSAICSGALHLFPDPRAALAEISRALKPGARLVGLTFLAGQSGLVRYAWFRERLKKRGTIRLFELPELVEDFEQAGFTHFQPQFMGSGVFFNVQKR